MINNTESKKIYEVQSGVTEYPIGFPFHFNADQTPQLSVVIGHDVLQLNYNCKLSEDKGTLILIPTEEEAENLTGPDDYSWMDKWVGAHLVIERDIPFVQESDYQLGRISAEQIEHDFDASVMRDQMLADKISEHTVDVQAEVDAINTRIDGVQQEHTEDMEDVDAALATKATKTELENAKTTLNVGIQGNAQAIQKTRDDYQAADQSIRADMNAKDSELETILNDHANRLDTLRTDHDDLGDDVSDIQAKIPESASGSNPLVTKQQLLDEEMDIREDVNSGLSEVQTQITAQAAAIAKKAEKDSVYTKEQVDAKVSSVYKVKGSVANYDSLPTDASIGDVYDTLDSGANYVWTENGWDKLGDIVDLTDYAKKEDLDGYLPLTGGNINGALELETATEGEPQQLVLRTRYLDQNSTWGIGTNYLGYLALKVNDTAAYYITPNSIFRAAANSRVNLGKPQLPWYIVYASYLNNGASISIPTEGGTLARIEDINAIGGEGTTGQVLTKTEDGFTWQDSAGGTSLPDQTDNAGKFLMTDGTTISWGDRLIVKNYSVSVGVGAQAYDGSFGPGVAIGYNAKAVGTSCVSIGCDTSHGIYNGCTSIGAASGAKANNAVAVGYTARVVGAYGIQLGGGTNNDANTFKVANENGNFEMMSADGTIPLERLKLVTDQIGDISTALTAIIGE